MANKRAARNKTSGKPGGKKLRAGPDTGPTAGSIAQQVRVRMFRQGLGDCFLLSFGGDEKFEGATHILIDCGTLGATTTGVKIKDVAASIRAATNRKLALLVATHEHLDHLSGFNSARETFDDLQVEHSWVAWTENPNDALAKSLKKYKNDLGAASLAAHTALLNSRGSGPSLKEMAFGIQEVLSFLGNVRMGAKFAEGVDAAMKYVSSRAPEGNRAFLMPGTFIQPDWLPQVTVFVLGPPHDEKKINNLGEHGNPELYELSGSSVTDLRAATEWFNHSGNWNSYCQSLEGAERERVEHSVPFDPRYRVYLEKKGLKHEKYRGYFARGNGWRRIDTDRLMGSADLALQLDNLTNNTSLALAFEIGENGPVILMAADAQLGNWLSWHDYTWKVPMASGGFRELKAKDLLARTILYKVGHHSSHNATAVEHGLEMMTSDVLVALIPLDKKVAISKKWPMPAKKLYDRLVEKTRGRVLRSDIGWPQNSDRPPSVSASEWKKLPPHVQIAVQNEYIDVICQAEFR
jgi:hypothetical protein